MIGTAHTNAYKIKSVWQKTRTVFPDVLQAATKIAVEDARAQWTTYNILIQWFDDVKNYLLKTGLVDDKIVLDDKGELVPEVQFKMHSEQQFINMDETHHGLSISGDKGGS